MTDGVSSELILEGDEGSDRIIRLSVYSASSGGRIVFQIGTNADCTLAEIAIRPDQFRALKDFLDFVSFVAPWRGEDDE